MSASARRCEHCGLRSRSVAPLGGRTFWPPPRGGKAKKNPQGGDGSQAPEAVHDPLIDAADALEEGEDDGVDEHHEAEMALEVAAAMYAFLLNRKEAEGAVVEGGPADDEAYGGGDDDSSSSNITSSSNSSSCGPPSDDDDSDDDSDGSSDVPAPDIDGDPNVCHRSDCVVSVPGGTIRWYKGKQDFAAACDNTKHGQCVLTRTSNPNKNPLRYPSQGRPLGLIVGWCAMHEVPSKADHWQKTHGRLRPIPWPVVSSCKQPCGAEGCCAGKGRLAQTKMRSPRAWLN